MESDDRYNEYEDEEEIETSKNEVKQMSNDNSMHSLLNKKDLTSDQKISIAKSNEIKRKKMEIATFRNDYSVLKAEIIVMDKNLGRNVVPRKRAVDQLNIIMKSDDFKERYENGFVAKRHWNVMMDFFRIDQDIVPELVILNEFLIEGIKQVANIVDISSTIDSSDRLLTQIEQILTNNNTIFTKILNNASDLADKTIQHHEDKVEKDLRSIRKINEISSLKNTRKCDLLEEEVMKLKAIVNALESVRYKKDSDIPSIPIISQSEKYNKSTEKTKDESFEDFLEKEMPIEVEESIEEKVEKLEEVEKVQDNNLIEENEEKNEEVFKKVDEKVSIIEPIISSIDSDIIEEKRDGQVVNDKGEVTSVSRLEDMKVFADEFYEKYHSFFHFKQEFRKKFSPDLTENELIERYRKNINKKNRNREE